MKKHFPLLGIGIIFIMLFFTMVSVLAKTDSGNSPVKAVEEAMASLKSEVADFYNVFVKRDDYIQEQAVLEKRVLNLERQLAHINKVMPECCSAFCEEEVCDGVDNDCDGEIDEGDLSGGEVCDTGLPGICGEGTSICGPEGMTCETVNEAAEEICDNLDNDCDGATDEGLISGTCDTGELGVCANGIMACVEGAEACEPATESGPEICDKLDNDCDGLVDENLSAADGCGPCIDLYTPATWQDKIAYTNKTFLIKGDVALCAKTYDFSAGEKFAFTSAAPNATLHCNGALINGAGQNLSTEPAILAACSTTDPDTTCALGAAIKNCRIENFNEGIRAQGADSVKLINNNIKNINYGLVFKNSNSGSIEGNRVEGAANYGIHMTGSANNMINNNYFNNTANAYSDSPNSWNTAKTAGENIVGGAFFGGNYWSDYSGTDSNGDGLGDTLVPYTAGGGIASGGDSLPLVD